MPSFPDGYGPPITAATDLDTDDVTVMSRDGLIKPVALSASRGCVYTAANTGSAYTATRTILNEDFLLTVTANTTITLAGGGITGEMSVWNIVFVEDTTGGRTIAVSNVYWADGTPNFTTTANVANHCAFVQHGTGTIFGYFGGAVATVTAFVSDTFTRADGAMGNAETGGAWTSNNHGGGAGTWGIVSNKAKVTTGAVISGENTVTADSTVADCTITCDVDWALENGICFRLTNGSNWNLLAAGNGSISFYKIVAGAYTQVGSTVTGQPTSGTHALKLVLSGSTWTGYVDNVQQIQATSQTNQQTATKHGLRTPTSNIAAVYANFVVTS